MPTPILIYEALISYLKDACNAGIPGRNADEVAQLHASLDRYLLSMASDNLVSGIVESVERLKTLLELSDDLGLTSDSKLRMALRKDEERIATFLVSIFASKSSEDDVLRLEGDSAQCFLDVLQSTKTHWTKANILINEDWSACLADFGLSIFSDATSLMTTNRGGSTYWMAPELLDPDRFGLKFARTPASDVYAFGCVCLELYTGRPPFSGILSEPGALIKVINGERPPRPSSSPAMSDALWSYVTTYWAQEPTTRPGTHLVVQNMFWPPPPAAIEIPNLFPASASRPGSPAMSELSLASTYLTAASSLPDNFPYPDQRVAAGSDPNISGIQLKNLYRTSADLEIKVKEKDNDEAGNAGHAPLEQGDASESFKEGEGDDNANGNAYHAVWIVSNEQLLAWVKNPVTVANVGSVDALKCNMPQVDASQKIRNGIPANEARLLSHCAFQISRFTPLRPLHFTIPSSFFTSSPTLR
ncbi:Kinase-like protein [Mycena sanguinolenta]|uniref:Kinase-like protein n=1 Tax=Mycena sanguinolenta TaxID=230812 RepID=A0A8H6XIC6_9AGAR|nr:Kinase-like protein [Mycena sanguinolenta]